MNEYTVQTETGKRPFKVTGPPGTGVVFKSDNAVEANEVSQELNEAYLLGVQDGHKSRPEASDIIGLINRAECLQEDLGEVVEQLEFAVSKLRQHAI